MCTYLFNFRPKEHQLFTQGNGDGVIWLPVAIASRRVKDTKIFSLDRVKERGGKSGNKNKCNMTAVSVAESVFKCKFLFRSWKPSSSQNAYRWHDLRVLKVLPCSEKTLFSELVVWVLVFFLEFKSQTKTIFTHTFHLYNVWSAVSQWVCRHSVYWHQTLNGSRMLKEMEE